MRDTPRLIVVDPRRVGLANKADLWLRVRPGSDGALALGIAGVMIERGWYDRGFVRDWTNGPLLVRADNGRLLTERDLSPNGSRKKFVAWDETGSHLIYDPATRRFDRDAAVPVLFGQHTIATCDGDMICRPAFQLTRELCQRYSPKTVASICWVEPKQVTAAARLLWESRPVAYYTWSGVEQHTNVTQFTPALALLYALTGSFDAPGGNVLFSTVPAAKVTQSEVPTSGLLPAKT